MVRQGAGAALHGLGCVCVGRRMCQQQLPAGHTWHGIRASCGRGTPQNTSHPVWKTWSLSHWHLPWPPHSTFFPQNHSKLLRLLILYQDSPALVWIPNIDFPRRRNTSRFSCCAHAKYFAATRKRSRSRNPRCGWEEQLPAEGHVCSKDDVATVINDRGNSYTSAKAAIQSLLSMQQGENRNGPVVSNPSHNRASPTLPTQLLFPQKNPFQVPISRLLWQQGDHSHCTQDTAILSLFVPKDV